MRLDYLSINGYKNLKDFSLQVDECYPFVVLVGQNGSGKSNLIEALVAIFRNLDLGEVCPFDYTIRYRLSQDKVKETHDEIEVRGTKEDQPRCFVNGNELTRREFMSYGNREQGALPAFIFGYYSGTNDRLAALFSQHQRRSYGELKMRYADASETALRRFFLAETSHGQYVLLSFFQEADDSARQFVAKHLGIVGLDSIHFVINKPIWAQPGTEDRFWGTTGTPRAMLESLDRLSFATTPSVRKINLDFRRKRTIECLNFLLDQEGFDQLAREYNSPRELFTALESTQISDLLLELRVNVKVRDASDSISFRELSEGEQQLLLVLGLLRFTKEDGALLLLDEPDTHLNPAWSIQYLEFIQEMVGELDQSHIVMATHDPLVFSGLSKDEVRIMSRDEAGQIKAVPPLEDPRGMGIEAILTSDLFRLRAAIDLPTLRNLDRRRYLEVKKGRNREENRELKLLNKELNGLDYSLDGSDPLYGVYVKQMTEWEVQEGLQKPSLSPVQKAARTGKALDIIKKLKGED